MPPRRVIAERHFELSGTWTGTYSISSCWPEAAPNSCTGYAKPGTLTLALVNTGSSLIGTFNSDLLGTLDVAGTVDASGAVTLSGERQGILNCFSVGPIITGVTGGIGDWSASITRTGAIAGSFKQMARQRVSSCYYAMFEYTTQVAELRRDPPPTRSAIDQP